MFRAPQWVIKGFRWVFVSKIFRRLKDSRRIWDRILLMVWERDKIVTRFLCLTARLMVRFFLLLLRGWLTVTPFLLRGGGMVGRASW